MVDKELTVDMPYMKITIFLNPGHWNLDPGASWGELFENLRVMKIRDALVPLLKRNGFEVQSVPDTLNLKRSIAWANERSKHISDGLALALHLNAFDGTKSGAEVYHYPGNTPSRDIAKKLVDAFCKESGMNNRGPKPDTQSGPGQLGWIRKTIPWATLLELGYIDNANDRTLLKDTRLMAVATAKAVCAVYGIPYVEDRQKEIKEIQLQLNYIARLLAALMLKLKGLLFAKK